MKQTNNIALTSKSTVQKGGGEGFYFRGKKNKQTRNQNVNHIFRINLKEMTKKRHILHTLKIHALFM